MNGPEAQQAAPGERHILSVARFPDGSVQRQTYEIGQIGDCKTGIEKASVSWVNITVSDMKLAASDVAASFGFPRELVDRLVEAEKSEYEDRDAELGMKLPAIVVSGHEVKVLPLIILVDKRMILTIHTSGVKRFVRFSRYAEGVMRKFKDNQPITDRITLLLIRILDENNEKNFDGLHAIQEEGERFSQNLVDTHGKADILGRRMHNIRSALVDYTGALWASLDVLHSLRYGDADAITDNPRILDKMSLLVEDVNRNIQLSEHVSEVLASGLGALQSIYNNELQIYNNQLQLLNNKLALLAGWLAVVATAVAVPNTLATFFGIAPIAALLPWQVIAFLIAASTVISTYFTYMYVRSKGLLPRSAEK